MKRKCHHTVIYYKFTIYAIWHQSLKNLHYRTLLIFQNKTTIDLGVKTWGGIKDMVFPRPPPPGIYALNWV